MTVTLTNSEIERLEKDKAHHLKTADNMVSGAERQKRDMNATEKQMFDSAMSAVQIGRASCRERVLFEV